MRVGVVGLGYMGLPTAFLLAKAGCEVVGFDVVAAKVELLNKGGLPFAEEGLEALHAAAKASFRATGDIQELKGLDAYIIAVPTPFTPDKKCDLSMVEAATRSLVPVIGKDCLVILESTVRPRTTVEVVVPILEESGMKAGTDFLVSYVSEKAIPGDTLREMVANARIIGGIDDASAQRTKELYSLFVKGEMVLTDSTTAETVKLVENTFRDINIAFANELARICEDLDINAWEVRDLANRHPRVNVHAPGPGVGGHCIAIDPWFLIQDVQGKLIATAREINDDTPRRVFGKMQKLLEGNPSPVVALLGAAYKRDVDDSRASPSETIAELCHEAGWEFRIHDPYVTEFPFPIQKDLAAAVEGADLVVVVTDHTLYQGLDLKGHVVLDTRNVKLDAKEHHLIGRDRI